MESQKKVDSFHSPSGCVATLLFSNAVRLSSTWALHEAGALSYYSSERINARAVDCAPLRPCGMHLAPPPSEAGVATIGARIHIQHCPRPIRHPAFGIFATSGRERFGWLTSFQPEDSRHRVRRATFPRYVVKALRTG